MSVKDMALDVQERWRISDPNTIFLVSMFFFMTDNVLNFFINIPVFVTYSMILLPVLWFHLWTAGKLNRFIVVSAVIFIITFVISNFLYVFNKRNLSDVVYVLLFITSFYYYQFHLQKIRFGKVHILLATVLLLFSFAFAGLNSGSFNKNKKITEHIEFKTPQKINHDQDALDILEYNRAYNYGLFRIPHVATYLLGFLGLFYGFHYSKNKNLWMLALTILLFILMIFTGVRTFAAAILLALTIYFIRRKTLRIFAGLIVVGLLLILFRYKIYFLTQHTILEPFTSVIITIFDNFDRLSRVLIWKSWLLEMQQFSWYNYLTGKSFYESILANIQNLHRALWFHNDFFSISFSYGVPALIVYIAFFIRM